jgi:hypothetical protein
VSTISGEDQTRRTANLNVKIEQKLNGTMTVQ